MSDADVLEAIAAFVDERPGRKVRSLIVEVDEGDFAEAALALRGPGAMRPRRCRQAGHTWLQAGGWWGGADGVYVTLNTEQRAVPPEPPIDFEELAL